MTVFKALYLVSNGTYVCSASLQRRNSNAGVISTCRLPCRKYLQPNESAKFHKSCKNKFSDLKLGHVEKQQKMSSEKRKNEISSNDSGNLEMPCSSKSSVLTRRHSKEKNEVAKEYCFFLRW